MDALVLDAAPLIVLAASGAAPRAAAFGLRWLLARLYLGAGAGKLLSCDASCSGAVEGGGPMQRQLSSPS